MQESSLLGETLARLAVAAEAGRSVLVDADRAVVDLDAEARQERRFDVPDDPPGGLAAGGVDLDRLDPPAPHPDVHRFHAANELQKGANASVEIRLGHAIPAIERVGYIRGWVTNRIGTSEGVSTF